MDARYRWTLTNLSDNDSVVLTADPGGWEQLTCKLSRDPIYHGVFIDFTMSLQFHCKGGGKQFIDNVYANEDVNAVIELLIEFNCAQTQNEYGELYTGRLNLASYKTDEEYTTVNIERSSLFSKLKSRENINVDLETTTSIGGETITAIDTEDILFPSMEITYVNEWYIEDGYEHRLLELMEADGQGIPAGAISFITPRMALIKDDFETSSAGLEYDEFGFQASDNAPFEDSFIQELLYFDGTLDGVAVDVPLSIDWEISFNGVFDIRNVSSAGTFTITGFKLLLFYGNKKPSQSNPNPAQHVELFFRDGIQDQELINIAFNVNESGTFNLRPGQKIWLAWYIDLELGGANGGGPTMEIDMDYDESFFRITSNTQFSDQNRGGVTTKTVLVHEALNQVCDAIADANGSFESDYYGRVDSQKQTYAADGCGSLRAISNGLNIREFDTPIFCNLREFFQSLHAVDNVGLTIENDTKVRVEKLSYFYDKTTQILNLTGGVKVETSNDNTRYYNRILIGYDRWDTEFRGGLQEPNTKHEYKTLINSINGDYTKMSKYIASAYAIELTRRKNINRFPDEDFRYDNDNFFIQLVRDAYVPYQVELLADSFIGGGGMDSIATAYNLRLTPARMLLAHIGNIAGCLQIINGQIKFVRGDGNTDLFTQLGSDVCQEEYDGEVLTENQSFDYNDANAQNIEPLWQPEIYRFDYPLTVGQLTTMRSNPHGYIQVTDDHGNTRKGYLLSADFRMQTGLTRFELLKVYE